MVWSIRSRISSLLCSKAPLVGSYVYDSCWCLCFSAPTSSSIARPWPNFMDWVQMDRCRAAASLPLIKEQNGPSESNAALEFAVTTLQVENILVIGHSSCAGIEALMNMQEDVESGFIHPLETSHTSGLPMENLPNKGQKLPQLILALISNANSVRSYPWIEDRVRRELLSLHGGHYNFSNCSFEKWTLDFKECNVKEEEEEESSYVVKEQEFWC
ncbi:beta carbonic anhydrase 5, chloroplastic-like isoform X2 [Glycine soja]|uniref:beta carbonic anhydrase 5, chloroplastic-like isoform X2 n=1 Tax=Glycine soja TaxID=3848 RepID=UPI001039733C|nr:beta carbonic anhydrase 5, chloroplastic-like isoform X2 [Glycine soja]